MIDATRADRSLSNRQVRSLHSAELRKMIEMRVSRVQSEPMLEREGSDPDVVRWDGCALHAELMINRCVLKNGGVIREERPHIWLAEKRTKARFVFPPARAAEKSRPQLC